MAKVYTELCAGLDKRSVAQAHLFQRLPDQMAAQTMWQNDGVWVRNLRGLVPRSLNRAEMEVHPRTGIPLVNRARRIAVRKREQARIGRVQNIG